MPVVQGVGGTVAVVVSLVLVYIFTAVAATLFFVRRRQARGDAGSEEPFVFWEAAQGGAGSEGPFVFWGAARGMQARRDAGSEEPFVFWEAARGDAGSEEPFVFWEAARGDAGSEEPFVFWEALVLWCFFGPLGAHRLTAVSALCASVRRRAGPGSNAAPEP
ncbi:hypothetical protein T484DRAFT_1859100 [Baffinella frigidus]|nr:hypothetical protein T484DRAFT_1859100 [Cryptophyta sp. CCMP2293]